MLRILIIDDTPAKVKKYKELLCEFDEINPKDIHAAASMEDAIQKMQANQFDLAILDLYLPLRHGDDPSPDNAIRLLKELSEEDSLKMPYNIVGITHCQDADPKYKEFFGELLLAYIVYDQSNDDWKSKLRNKIEFLIKAQRSVQNSEVFDYDVAIVNALQLENTHAKRALGEDGWMEHNIPADKSTVYYTKRIITKSGSDIRVVTCYALQMASTASAVLTTKVIYNFRPRYLFMTGIAAGVDRKEINLGDIMVADKVWDGASGKIKPDEEGADVFHPDFHELPLNTDIQAMIKRLSANRELLNNIEEHYLNSATKPQTRLNVKLGPIASVPAVLSSEGEVTKLISHCRKLLGIEMEGYGMFFAANNSAHPRPEYVCLIKSVSDFADAAKSDNYQDYCMYTSAAFAAHIILNELSY